MGRTKTKNVSDKASAFGKKQGGKPPHRDVLIVSCPSAFPISSKTRSKSVHKPDISGREIKSNSQSNVNNYNVHSTVVTKNKGLDWSQTVREVHALGAKGFVGKQKRAHEDEQYELLTGRKKKRHYVPLPIVRGIRKKAEQREKRQLQEAKEAGIVLPQKPTTNQQAKKRKKSNDSNFRVHGPSPSIGFMKNGIFRVKEKPN